MKNEFILNGKDLSTSQVWMLCRSHSGEIQIKLSDECREQVARSRAFIDSITKEKEPVYGINTGFGAFSNKFIDSENLVELQYNLIRSHCTGVGKPLDSQVVKALMLIRANCLIQGNSGISLNIIELLIDFLNHDIVPIIPSKGSVGASGDLAPLAHMSLCLIGEGMVMFEGKEVRADYAIHKIGKKPAELHAKDGLALINGTSLMAAIGSVALEEAKRISKLSDLSAAMTVDGIKGSRRAFDPKISYLKPHAGQIDVTHNLNNLLEGSEIIDSHEDCDKVQDPYSLRCVPQVHGAIRYGIKHFSEVLEIEINSVTDNPLVFPEEEDIISGGNFHGEALALGMDYLAICLSEYANISERRVEKLINPTFSELPAFLTEQGGLNSGLMIAHVTAAALVSENKVLSHPASVDSVPTSTDKEDHVSMGVTSGLKLLEIIDNVKNVLSIELLCATQALDFQSPLKSSDCIESARKVIRSHVPKIGKDRVFGEDMKKIKYLIENNQILNEVENVLGELR